MPSAFEKLEKILKLEISQGYGNRAVIGGFETFAGLWQDEAREEIRAREEIQDEAETRKIDRIAALLRGYPEADRQGRMETVDSILKWLSPEEQAASPRPPALHKPGSTPTDKAQAPPPPPLPTSASTASGFGPAWPSTTSAAWWGPPRSTAARPWTSAPPSR